MSLTGTVLIRNADAIDAGQIDEMTKSSAWALFIAKIDGMIEGEQRTCENTSASDIEVRGAQRALQVLRRVKDLPQMLKREIQQRAK